MFIVFGNTSKFTPLESLISAHCQLCAAEQSWTIWREKEWATLMFIPVIPVATRYHLGCDNCGYGLPLDKQQAEAMLEPARRNQALHDAVVAIIRKNQASYRARMQR